MTLVMFCVFRIRGNCASDDTAKILGDALMTNTMLKLVSFVTLL